MKIKHVFVFSAIILMFGAFLVVPSTMISPTSSSYVPEVPLLEKVGTISADQQLEELKLNVNENPSFETLDSNDWPESYSGSARGYAYTDPAYTSNVNSGTYAGYFASHGVPGSGTTNGFLSRYFGVDPLPTMATSLTLDFYWNTLNNPDIDIAAYVYLLVQTTNSTGGYHEIRYYLSNNYFNPINMSSMTAYKWNYTIGNWNHFSRNLTADYNANPLISDADSTRRITYLRWYATTSAACRNTLEVALDDVSLTNGTYSAWISNGDFETGDGQDWAYSQSTPLYVSQSLDSTDGTYSLNMTSGVVSSSGSYADGSVRRSYTYPTGYYLSGPGDIRVSFDWKFNCTMGSDYQAANFRVTFENETDDYYYNFYLGYGADSLIGLTNASNNIYISLDGINVRDTWHHAELDLFEYFSEFGSLAGTIDDFMFYMYVPGVGSQSSLLVDDFNVITSPTGDPSFEQDWYESAFTVFAGWQQYSGNTITNTRTADAHTGSYACNLTPYTSYDNAAGVIRPVSFPISSDDFLNVWWRLDSVTNADESVAYIKLELDGGYSLNYVLGRAEVFPVVNSTSNLYFDVDNFNTTGEWVNLHRNITADTQEGLGLSGDIILDNILIRARSGHVGLEGSLITLIVDDVIITDGAPPVANSVDQLPITPMYYDHVDIHIDAFDARPGIDHVIINYTTNGGATWDSLSTIGTYNATIPAQPYGTHVEYYFIMTDGCGLQSIDDNGGIFYSYDVGDDVAPTLTITNPVNNTDQEGMLTITADVADAGAGIMYVEFDPDIYGPDIDDIAPYSYDWNLDATSLGLHYIDVTAFDNLGNNETKRHFFTVVDTIDPTFAMNSHLVIEGGSTGYFATWNPSDSRPGSYEVFVDEVLAKSGNWNSTFETVRISLDGLALGSHNYTCVVYDDGGNSAKQEITVTAVDWTYPTIDGLDDFAFTEGETGYAVNWNGTDLYPDHYVIMENGITVAGNDWNSSLETISYSLDGLSPGEYNYTCVIYDGTGNWIADTVIVTVNAESTTTTSTTIATTTTTTTSTTTDTTSTPPPENQTMLMLMLGVGGIVIILVIVVIVKKRT